MGRLFDALQAESKSGSVATPATFATKQAKSSGVAEVARGQDFQTGRLLGALRSAGLPTEWLGLDHGNESALAALTDIQLSVYVAMLAESIGREQGKAPADETAPALCRQCGPIWLHPAVAGVAPVVNGWSRVMGCAWCHIKNRQVIACPKVTCNECTQFVRDTVNPADGLGRCGAGCDPARPLPYPHAARYCATFDPNSNRS